MVERDTDEALKIVVVEDIATEMELAARQLHRAGMSCEMVRVETEGDLLKALNTESPDLVISDFSLPQFDGMSALRLTRQTLPDVPFIFVSGTIGEERAIEALRHGATDYILKTNLARLAPAVKRALHETEARRAKARAEQKLHDLVRANSMLSNINSAALRSLGRKELLEEAARIAADHGGYGLACVFLTDSGKASLRPFVWKGSRIDAITTPGFVLSSDSVNGQSITAQAIRSREPVVCNDLHDRTQTIHPSDRGWTNTFRSVVALPLIVDETAVGTLNLYSTRPNVVDDDELNMLRQVAGNVSFALQYLHKEDKVQFLAYFDPLTGLAQRSLFSERLARMLNPGQDAEGNVDTNAVANLFVSVFDIERLSAINDRYGRHTGDHLLQLIAERLKALVPDTDCLGHFGGGRFGAVFVVPEGTSEANLSRLVQGYLTHIFEQPFPIEGEEVRASARSGAARFPRDGGGAEVLIQNAELALRSAREKGDRYSEYMREMNRGQVQRFTMEHKLRRALDERQFVLHYQPKISVDDKRIVGVEALMRWHDPESGMVSPGAFIPVLEESGLIVDVGRWALEQAVADGQRWQEQSGVIIPIAVNVSNLQLRRKDFVDEVLAVVDSAGSVQLDVEITESALMEDLAGATRTLARLKEAGVSIAIDDFGTGYSSLRQLSKLPVDTLKIDRSFISGLSSDPADMTIVSMIIALARAFDLTAVAEGVETEEQLKLLRLLKCHQLQGYLIAKPMPPEEFSRTLGQPSNSMMPPRAMAYF